MSTGTLAPVPLLRAILRLHRRLPPAMRAVGNAYVTDEFKRHRKAAPEFVGPFLRQWTEYLDTLRAQTDAWTPGPGRPRLGRHLREEELNSLSDEQLGQLHELRSEAAKPWS